MARKAVLGAARPTNGQIGKRRSETDLLSEAVLPTISLSKRMSLCVLSQAAVIKQPPVARELEADTTYSCRNFE